MQFKKKFKLAIAFLLALLTLAWVVGCSQESPPSKTLPNANLVPTASPVVASNQSKPQSKPQAKPQRTFTPAIVKTYVEGCQSAGGTPTYCNCFMEKVQATFSPDDFDKANEDVAAGKKMPDAITKIMQSCQTTQVPTQTASAPTDNSAQNVSVNPPVSENAERSLALHLKKIGAIMYGTYWCPYCNRQKEAFGDAVKEITYIECDPRGDTPKPELCASEGVSSYPTWKIKGLMYNGMMPLSELASLSGYEGSRNFRS